MKVGLIGLPGAGVTSLFSLFTGRDYEVLNRKNEVHLGEIPVPDSRLDVLTELFHPRKKVYATIRFADTPVELEANGSFTGRTISTIRDMEIIALVVRAFENPLVPHPLGRIDPLKDIETILDDAILTDLIQVEEKLKRLNRECRLKTREGELFLKIKQHLEQSEPLRTVDFSREELKMLSGYRFLSQKEWLIILNTDSEMRVDITPATRYCDDHNLTWQKISAQFELEITALDPEDQKEFLAEIGEQVNARERFIQAAYAFLNRISFFTVGEDECRAWPITKGDNAVTAAGRIHSDLAKGFIRAEVVAYQDFIDCGGSMAAARKSGKHRLEGKNYIVQDGDIMNIRFNI